jgi:hypothetical protein
MKKRAMRRKEAAEGVKWERNFSLRLEMTIQCSANLQRLRVGSSRLREQRCMVIRLGESREGDEAILWRYHTIWIRETRIWSVWAASSSPIPRIAVELFSLIRRTYETIKSAKEGLEARGGKYTLRKPTISHYSPPFCHSNLFSFWLSFVLPANFFPPPKTVCVFSMCHST